jgi:ATP-dependent DNA helicase HFM1/MER3
LVNDKRGSVLECLVARLKLYELKTAKYLRPRIVMVSATIPNAVDFETWLDSHEANKAQNGGKDTELFVFGDDVKSVTVSRTVIGFTNKKNNAWLLEQSMNRDLYKILERNDALSETVVFCNTRKSCENTSEELKKNFKKVFQLNDKVECKKLKELLQFGLAFHHGGVQQSDRLIIEKLFAEKKIHILCATTTLCVGVNLPINCVVVKSTQIYNSEKKKYEEYSDNDVLQMIGRAGRNTNGKVIIMTDKQRVSHFELLFKGKEIESSLLSKEDGTATLDTLKELIVNEVLAGLIRSGDDCLSYLKETFLAVRLGRGSLFYMPLLRSVLGFKGSLKNYDSVLPKLSKLVMDGLQKDGLLSPSVTAAEEPKTAEVLMSDTSIEIKSLGLSKPGPTLKYIRDHLKHNSTVALVFETLCNVPEFQCEKKHLDTLPDTKLKEFTLPLQISSYNKVITMKPSKL